MSYKRGVGVSIENTGICEIAEIVSRYCELQMIKPDDVYIELHSDKEGRLHVVSFDVTVSVDLDRDAKIVNKKLFDTCKR